MQCGPAAPCAPMLCVVQCLCKGPQALFLLILKLFAQPDDSVDDVIFAKMSTLLRVSVCFTHFILTSHISEVVKNDNFLK